VRWAKTCRVSSNDTRPNHNSPEILFNSRQGCPSAEIDTRVSFRIERESLQLHRDQFNLLSYKFRLVVFVFALVAASCGPSSRSEPKKSGSITALIWTSGPSRTIDRELVSEFTRETGVTVELVPAPESNLQRLSDELKSAPNGLDVIAFDLAWNSQLGSQLIDLRDALRDRLDDELPGTVDSVVVGNRVTGAPFFVDYGLLYYRTDLLRKYGFKHPPATWDELETQARTIQRGERAGGHQNFWGYVWQGDAYEGLTCNALEWQYSHGGGNLISAGGTPHTANEKAVGAFAQAARWIGTISPPGVLAYMEEDSRDVWQSGNAAFLRNWAYVYALAKADAHIADHFAVSPLPAGSDSHSSVIGGWYLGIPSSSQNRPNAIAFVRFMTSRSVQVKRAIAAGNWPTLKAAYEDPQLQQSELFEIASQAANRAIRRPVALLGSLYPCVSDVYARSIHDILSGKIAARSGAQGAEAEISSILRSAGKQGCP
jgi:trehalose/maltose transport system substrate-binding protein